MSNRLRTFIAVGVDPFTRDRLVGLQKRLADGGAAAKWVEPANLHVTLLFLGEVHSRETPDICRIAAEVAKQQSSFAMTLLGAGAFPTPRRPRTLIVHITEGSEDLVRLHAMLEPPLLELGCYRREERAFKPHLTIGRVKGKADDPALSGAIQKFAAWEGGETRVRELLVLSSSLLSEGPEYVVLSRAPLQSG